MIKAIALDDEPPALRILANFSERIDFIDLQKTFIRTNDAMEHLKNNPVDLIFLDINMPSISGLDFYQTIQQDVMVIFTTAYAEHAVQGFNLKAIDYLLKPFTFERFQQGVSKANEYHQFKNPRKNTKYLLVRADYSLHKIAYSDILFIEGLDDYLKIHTQNAKPLVARMTMKAILQKLPEQEFIRVHRSYIIPFARIENIRNKIISLAGEEIPIGSSYEETFAKRFKA
ncbi:LytTR family DNA-binding domain-containing protein [Dyadobacter sp. CY345]|uniref:LytR/AlgR family response regulator transcription factor n=1 Tax=Dyadobacter sp. CY345 TaxID=2909335 RepID=UPI001F1A490E|nr:LytTR family DNA-binding domain-containing protein [Dyadobacter sp. CY345]MCF2446403.1 LytTR family DNA-binding domain-containing protein [Dyadobacter sp. CY345]